MAFDVVHAHQRFIESESHGLCIRNPNEKRTNQAWANGDSNAINRIFLNVRTRERLIYNRHDLVEMFSRSEFWNYAAKFLVRSHLRRDN
jgi:hypothetical protein